MKRNNKKSGFSLIEIMVAMLLLLVLLVGGAMVLFQTGADIQVYGNKRVALELARSEMEDLLATDYHVLRARAVSGGPETFSGSETWNGVSISINWTNRLVAAGGILDNEYLQLDVQAGFPGSDAAVRLHATKTITP